MDTLERVRILVVDDNPDDLALASREISRAFPNAEVVKVGTPEGLALALAGPPFDACITDFQLQWSDGLQVMRAVKSRGLGCPVVMFTATANQDQAVEALKSGLDDYLTKSHDHFILLGRILRLAMQRALERRSMIETQRLVLVGRSSSALAHEINNALGPLSTALFLLAENETLTPDGRRRLELAQLATARAAEIARLGLGLQRDDRRPAILDLHRIVAEVAALYGPRLSLDHVRLAQRLEATVELVGFSLQIHQLVANLVVNALDAVSRHGNIVVHTFDRPARGIRPSGVCIVVADDGAGMSAAIRTQLFQPFFTTKGQTGTGLGLWVSRTIANEHGGDIRVRSCPGGSHAGSVFEVFLPVRKAMAAAPAA